MKLIVEYRVEGVNPSLLDPEEFAEDIIDPSWMVRSNVQVSVESARWEGKK